LSGGARLGIAQVPLVVVRPAEFDQMRQLIND
jgi:hypothetical protein